MRIFALTLLLCCSPGLLASQKSPWAPADSGRLLLRAVSFPQLPPVVRADLERRGCRIPQASGPDVSRQKQSRPNNVVSGPLFSRGTVDWAVLCSIRGSSRILIYANGETTRIDSLANEYDSTYLFKEEGYARAFYRELGTASPEHIRELSKSAGQTPPAGLDHYGLDDYLAGKASTIYYFRRNRWITFQGWN